MSERGPDYEDEKLRTWSFGSENQEPEKFEQDPTVMHLDVEREEIFESRTYCLQPTPEVLLYLIDLLISQQPDLDASSDEAMLFAREMIEDTTFRFLAKRDKDDGLVSSLLVAVGGDERYLLLQQEQVEESEYRQAVQDFETIYLPDGIVTAPLVVTLEEWRAYNQEEPFSEMPPDSQR